MNTDTIGIEIMPDGTVKVTTDQISAANHMTAEQFIAWMARALGGETTMIRKPTAHPAHHAHIHGGN